MKKNEFEEILKQTADQITDSRVKDAMLYSLMAGGKRIRPMMLYAIAAGYGLTDETVNRFACALEMIHTYSLIHDDLPAMDNDDLRRGRPTCHKAFDEATAILAGDGLLTYAFETAASTSGAAPEQVLRGLRILAADAGPDGMVLGQCLDMQESALTDWEALQKIHHHKTGCLLSAPLEIGAVMAGCDEETCALWRQIGFDIGLAFQLQDDILDVEKTAAELGKSNSDERNDKVTGVSLLGIEKARTLMNQLYDDSFAKIEKIKGFESDALTGLLREVQYRNH
ncbi:MAG: polyprenyl synthetase family protein [Solobacterium sp.]|nr:polyprenyl synthetase family protein [Solobacterium sp.]